MKLKVPRVVELEIVAFWVMWLYKGFSEYERESLPSVGL